MVKGTPIRSVCHFFRARIKARSSFSWTGWLSSAPLNVIESKVTGLADSHVSPKESTAPEQKLLASVETNILFFGILFKSIVVRHSHEITIYLIVSKAL